MEISIVEQDESWQKALIQRIVPVCQVVLRSVPLLKALEPERLGLSIVLANNAQIQEYNHTYRRKNQPTNVLSFPNYPDMDALLSALEDGRDEEAGYLGDILLARETLECEAQEQKKPLSDHFIHLLVHGILHLLGYDHMAEEEAEIMETLEIALLKELSVANPYESRL